ncbi:MAG: hypothetical protein ACXWTS_03575 [Methylococcaceae bacterium]
MNQQFESDVMHDLMADSPNLSADEAFEEESFGDGFEEDSFEEGGMEEDVMMDDMDQYEEADAYGDESFLGDEGFEEGFEEDFGDEFAEEEEMDAMDAMEEVVANAMDAEESDEFLRRLISGIRGVAGAVSRGAGTVGRVAGRAQRVAGQVGRVARSVQSVAGAVSGGGEQRGPRGGRRRVGSAVALQGLLPLLQQHAAQGTNEMDMFEDLVDWFEQEEADEALPIVAGIAARSALRPVIRRGRTTVGRAVNRQIVRGATQAVQNLTRQQGPQAVRALRPIAASIGRVAARRGMRPTALPNAIRRATARVAAQPALTRRLVHTTVRISRRLAPRTHLNVSIGSVPRRLVVNGPVEIIIRR